MPRNTTPVAGWGLAIVLLVGSTPQARAEVILYQTGFESPPFTAGLPVNGQAGWLIRFPVSNGAGVITTSNPSTGLQAVQVNGGALQPTGFFNPDLLGVGYRTAGFNFDAVAAGNPVVRVEADVRLDGPLTNGDLISANIVVGVGPNGAGGVAATIILSSDGHVYGFGFNSNDPDDYSFGYPVALGQYHRLALEVDFAQRLTRYYVDGNFLGTTLFNPAFASNVFWRPNLEVYGVYPAVGYNPADYRAYFDNYRITATPEPGTLALLGVALTGVVVARPWRRRPA